MKFEPIEEPVMKFEPIESPKIEKPMSKIDPIP